MNEAWRVPKQFHTITYENGEFGIIFFSQTIPGAPGFQKHPISGVKLAR